MTAPVTSDVAAETYSGGVAGSRGVLARSVSWASTRFAVIAVWVVMVVVFVALKPDTFLSVGPWRSIFGSPENTAHIFLVAALLCTIIIGDFVDMSIANNFGFAAILLSVLNANEHVNGWVASLIALAASTVVGAINGWLVVGVGVNAIVVTLGMGTFLLGVAQYLSHLEPVFGVSKYMTVIATRDIGGLPIAFFFGVVLMVGFAYVMGFTPLGRNMRFIFENAEVSRLAGVHVRRIRFGAFTVGGLIAGVGGVIAAAGVGGFDPNTGGSYLLPMFAAAFLGTAILEPGRFNPLGSLLAVFFLGTGVLGLQLLGANAWITNVFYGGVLVVAVAITTILHRRVRH